jgi:chromosome segregation ATPase
MQTMVSVLKDHTTLIQDMRGEVSGLTKAVRGLIATADQNVEIIQELKSKVVENKAAIDIIQASMDGVRKDITDIREKISVLPDFDERIKVRISLLRQLHAHNINMQYSLNRKIVETSRSCQENFQDFKYISIILSPRAMRLSQM